MFQSKRRIGGLVAVFLAVATLVAAGTQLMSLQVKNGVLRTTPSFLGTVVATLAYGDRVEVQAAQGDWRKVAAVGAKATGWIHVSALSSKKIVLKAGAADVRQTASSEEIALAGKGFNQQVENAFKAKNPNVDFGWIDRMEAFDVSQAEMEAFLSQGGVTPKGGS